MLRDTVSNDLLTVILFCSILLIVILKKIDPSKFKLIISLRKSDINNKFFGIKFIDIIYKILFVSNLSILLTFYKIDKFEIVVYLSLFKLLSIFFILRIFIDYMIGNLFAIKELMKNYINSKIIYFNSLGFVLLIFNFLVTYYFYFNNNFTLIYIFISLLFLVYIYFSIFFSMKKILIKNWFYFILYLCTLEIIPYYYLISNVL
jgi:hypothetical protein